MTNPANAYQTEGRLSYTAAFISLKYSGLYEEEAYQKAVIPELQYYYKKLESQHQHTILHLLTSLLFQPTIRKVLKGINESVLPGDLNHIALRKWFMFQHITQLQAQHGGLNVVFLGSGLDPLTHYLADLSQNNLIFELDSRPVIQIKQSAGFSFERIHISHTVSELFNDISAKQNPAFPTVYIVEGFWDYSTESQIKNIIAQISETPSSESLLLTTYFNFPEMTPYDAKTIRRSTASVGEKITNPLSLNQFSELLEIQHFDKYQHLSPVNLKNQLRDWNLSEDLIDEFHLLGYRNTSDG